MNYHDVIKDFAERTKRNLDYIENSLSQGEEVYEVTQLVNSLLGLLVFPQQRYFKNIPRIPLSQLQEEGWPHIKVIGDFEPAKDLHELMRYLRNAIAHFNIEFFTDENQQISGLTVWNVRKEKTETLDGIKWLERTSWKAKIPLEDLRIIVDKFIELIICDMKG